MLAYALAAATVAREPASAANWTVAGATVSLVGSATLVTGLAPQSDGSHDPRTRMDAFGLAQAERVTDGGWTVGAVAAGATVSGSFDPSQYTRAYVYAAGTPGRVELGLQSGAARRLSLHAPLVGSGQIRGDFARYDGAPALLWPFNSRQAFKLLYLSPPRHGLRFGASWTPAVAVNGVPLGDVFESVVRFEPPPVATWTLAASATFVRARQRAIGSAALDGWGAGIEARHQRWTVGSAYIDQPELALVPTVNQSRLREWNAGVAWRAPAWEAALSAAATRSRARDQDLAAAGLYRNLGSHVTVGGDLALLRERRGTDPSRNGVVALTNLDVHF